MQDKQQIVDMLVAGAAGTATNFFYRLKRGKIVTARGVIIELVLAGCSIYASGIVCDVMNFGEATAKGVFFMSAWLGSRAVAIIEKNAEAKIEQALGKLTDRL